MAVNLEEELKKKNRIIERLRKELDKYGKHYPSCEMVKYPNAKCTCGFEQVLKGE